MAPSKVRAGLQHLKGERRGSNTQVWPLESDSLGISLFSSIVIHALLILIVSSASQSTAFRPQHYFPVRLVEIQPPPAEVALPTPPAPLPARIKEQQAPRLPPRKAETPNTPTPAPRASIHKHEPPAPPVKTLPPEPRAIAPKQPESAQIGAGNSAETGGSQAGLESFSAGREVGVAPGPGTGGVGSAAIGPGRGAGPPGPATQTVLRTNREAKPIQTARATYPTMALRAGLESDVLLRIEVDPHGNVTKAEIVQSGGAGFDEEALRAVQQSRFEPAQRDGQNVAAEFTYIYRFRLQR